jgi:hypothetical protein
MTATSRLERTVTIGAIAVTAARIVVSVTQRPHYFLNTPHDDANYVQRALMFAGGDWATRFDQYTFIRGPLYPLYLAVVSRSGLPLPLVDVTLQCAVSLFLAYEIAQLLRLGRVGLVAVYGSLFFVPIIETLSGSHVIRDNFAQLLLLAVVATGLHAWRTWSAEWTITTALGVGLMAIVREDAIWLIPWGAAVAAVLVVRRYRQGERALALLIALAAPVAYWLPGAMVVELNARDGLHATTLFDDSHFVRAHQSLARYVNDGTSNTFTLTPAMLDDLIERSPAMETLAPGFRAWQLDGGIVYVDAMRFALADGLAASGALPDRSRRSQLLDELTDQLDTLCTQDDRPACGAFAGPPPIPVVRFSDVMDAARRPFTGLEQLLMVEGPPFPAAGLDGPVEQLRDWERATNTSPPPGTAVIEGGTVHFTSPSTTVGSVLVKAYLMIGRILAPITRVAGLLCGIFLATRRRWRMLALGGALLLCAYLRAAQVGLAEHFFIGDYDFHYVQPAATLVHITALLWLCESILSFSSMRFDRSSDVE